MLSSSDRVVESLPEIFSPMFEEGKLPDDAKSFDQWASEETTDRDFLEVAEYVFSRGDDIAKSKFFWSPSKKNQLNRRFIIPFYFRGKLVGYTARTIDNHKPKYWSKIPPNFLFNNKMMEMRDRKFVILVEGVLDALAIEGVSTLGAKLNSQQTTWLKSCGKEIIVLVDRDSRGKHMIDLALKNKWSISFPAVNPGKLSLMSRWWDDDVKDAADAVKKYGRLYTLTSILETRISHPVKIKQYQTILS